MRIICVGNPGTGKSTLLNGIIGDSNVQFKSGVSFGKGLTCALQWVRDCKTGYWYGDTPGLSDVKLRETAAKEITKALKTEEDEYKIVFVITEEAGRVRPVDVTTIATVLRAIVNGGAVKNPMYGIIVNKISKKKIKILGQDPGQQEAFFTCLQCEFPTRYIHLYAHKEQLEDENDMLHTITPELLKFLSEVPSMQITPDKVEDVKVQDYEKEMEKLETQLQLILEDKKVQEKKFNEDNIKLEKQFKEELAAQEKKSEQMHIDMQRVKKNQILKEGEYNKKIKGIEEQNEVQRKASIKVQEEFEENVKLLRKEAEEAKKASNTALEAEIRHKQKLAEAEHNKKVELFEMAKENAEKQAAKDKENFENERKRTLELGKEMEKKNAEIATQLHGMEQKNAEIASQLHATNMPQNNGNGNSLGGLGDLLGLAGMFCPALGAAGFMMKSFAH